MHKSVSNTHNSFQSECVISSRKRRGPPRRIYLKNFIFFKWRAFTVRNHRVFDYFLCITIDLEKTSKYSPPKADRISEAFTDNHRVPLTLIPFSRELG